MAAPIVARPPGEAPPARDLRWWTLGAMCMGMFMIFLDATIVNVALPSIQRDLGAQISDLQWVLNAYTLVVGVLLITGGRFGDLFGRKRVVLVGIAVFTIGSGMAGLAQDIHFLIAARALQGLGGAMLLPGTLSIIATTFEGPQRVTAIGIWSGVSGCAIALGPVLGGIMVEKATWESIFWVNLPIGAAALVVGWFAVRESRDETSSQRIDVPGVLVISLALLSLTLAFIQGNDKGWTSAYIIGLLVAAVVLLALFIGIEKRSPNPLLDLRFFRSSTFSGANAAAFTATFGMFAYFFFITLYLQDVLQYSALQTGLRLLPQSALTAFIAPFAGRLTNRFGSRGLMAIGQLMLGCSLLLATQWTSHASYLELFPAFALGGIGFGLLSTPLAAAVVGSVPRERSGAASGMMNTMRQIGGTLGVASLGALFTHQVIAEFVTRGRNLGLTEQVSRQIGADVASTGAQAVAGLPAQAVQQATVAAKSAFVVGLTETLYVNATVILLGALITFLFVRSEAAPAPVEVLAET